MNRQQRSKETYNACPYCLTEITITETENNNQPEKETIKIASVEEKLIQNQEKLPDCKHYFGYMSEKEHKQQMAEECMLCPQIINCMKQTGSTKC